MAEGICFAGLDVHARKTAAAAVSLDSGEVFDPGKLCSQPIASIGGPAIWALGGTQQQGTGRVEPPASLPASTGSRPTTAATNRRVAKQRALSGEPALFLVETGATGTEIVKPCVLGGRPR